MLISESPTDAVREPGRQWRLPYVFFEIMFRVRVLLMSTYRADKKEPLADLLRRLHEGFLTAGLPDPMVRFAFADAPVPGFTSAVERALKKFPKLEPFRCARPTLPGAAPVDQISNCPGSPAEGQTLDLFTLLALAQGVPRSLPFHNVMVLFHHAAFGEALPMHSQAPAQMPGVIAGDSWWINGRNRSLVSLLTVDAEAGSKKLPPPPPAIAAVLAVCGKPKEVTQLPLPSLEGAASTFQAAQADPELRMKVAGIQGEYRARLAEIVDKARMPHALPDAMEALRGTPPGLTSGPKKPALTAAFEPMGYSCRGGSGVFTLRRSTAANLTVEITLDVGTWSNSLTAFYEVHGLGFTARLPLPPAKSAMGALQYPIGDGERWDRIVQNLAALVAELDRTFVPAIEAVAGPAPAWYQPKT